MATTRNLLRALIAHSTSFLPRKAGPGITTADLLVINKTALAPHVGADLAAMAADAKLQRGDFPVVFTSLTSDDGIREMAGWITAQLTGWRTEAAV